MNQTKSQMLAVIREDECIGCTKCIQACPVDAILGSANNMHTVIASECIGCKLCVAPCPVDCIDLVALSAAQIGTFDEQTLKKSLARTRFKQRNVRLFEENQAKNNRLTENNRIERKHYIEAALARSKAKKSNLTTA